MVPPPPLLTAEETAKYKVLERMTIVVLCRRRIGPFHN